MNGISLLVDSLYIRYASPNSSVNILSSILILLRKTGIRADIVKRPYRLEANTGTPMKNITRGGFRRAVRRGSLPRFLGESAAAELLNRWTSAHPQAHQKQRPPSRNRPPQANYSPPIRRRLPPGHRRACTLRAPRAAGIGRVLSLRDKLDFLQLYEVCQNNCEPYPSIPRTPGELVALCGFG